MTRSGFVRAATGVLALVLAAGAARALSLPKPKYAVRLEDVAAQRQAQLTTPAASMALASAANFHPPQMVAPAPVALQAQPIEAQPVMAAATPSGKVTQSALLAPVAPRAQASDDAWRSAPAKAGASPFTAGVASLTTSAANFAKPGGDTPVAADRPWPETSASASKRPSDPKGELRKAAPASKTEKHRLTGYTVHAGDTLSGVGRRFGVPVKAILAANGLSAAEGVRTGQALKLPSEARDLGEDPHAKGQPTFGAVSGGAKVAALEPKTAPKAAPKTAPRMAVQSSARTPIVGHIEPIAPPPPPASQIADAPAARTRGDPMRPSPAQSGPFAPVVAPPGAPITGSPSPAQTASAAQGQGGVIPMRAGAGGFPDDSRLASLGRGHFLWPVRGDVLSRFGTVGPGLRNDGLNIAASAGSGVHASAGGEVVYAGNSLPDFGNLVLIKHTDGWVTAYGHLSAIEVRMRQTVAQGQEIGRVGQTGGVDRPQLHFEVRYSPSAREKARPVDPSLILP